MSFSNKTEKSASIHGGEGNALTLNDFTALDDGYCKALVYVKSDWFQATVLFEASNERFLEFIGALQGVLQNGSGQANFINEEGNFDLDVELTNMGKVNLWGVLCKDMSDDLQIKYRFASDRISLEGFLQEMESVFNSQESRGQSC